MDRDEHDTIYHVVINDKEQYTSWPGDREPPPGRRVVGTPGQKAECLVCNSDVWTGMRLASLRKKRAG